MPNIKILVCAHKKDYVRQDDVYMPIQVGKAISSIDLGFQGDDTGDNISDRNDWYAELTAMYWAWKNLKGVDYIGLCHYRRYFNFHTKGLSYSEYQIVKTEEIKKLNLDLPDVEKGLKHYDVILPKFKYYSTNLFRDYSFIHNSEEIRFLIKVIKQYYPAYYPALSQTLKCNKLLHYNMYIMSWQQFDSYSSWLFDVLDTLDKKFKSVHYTPLQRRVFGFMGERLMTTYAIHHHWKIKHYPLYWVADEYINISFFHRILRRLKGQCQFFFSDVLAHSYPVDRL